MPESFPEPLRAAWLVRRKQSNQNGHEAVIEMASFAQLNGVEITKEVVAQIRAQADDEWCAIEPTRCARRTPSSALTRIAVERVEPAAAIVQPRRSGSRAPAKKKKCCGAR